MIRIAIDDVKSKKWEKIKGFDILVVQTNDGQEYQIVLTNPDSRERRAEDEPKVA